MSELEFGVGIYAFKSSAKSKNKKKKKKRIGPIALTLPSIAVRLSRRLIRKATRGGGRCSALPPQGSS
jgi:hypothetical protein